MGREDDDDVGSLELGFNSSSRGSRRRDFLETAKIAPPLVLSKLHDAQMPASTLGPHRATKVIIQ